MREIEHRRHSWRHPDGIHLTQQGVELARRVGETMGAFDLVITSEIPRAFETAIAMGYAVDRQEPALFGDGVEIAKEVDWTLGFAEFARGFRLHGATHALCLQQAALLNAIAAELPPDGRALLVSHGGTVEQGVVGLLPEFDYSAWGAACERCEGVRIRFDDAANCVDVEVLRLPPGWQ